MAGLGGHVAQQVRAIDDVRPIQQQLAVGGPAYQPPRQHMGLPAGAVPLAARLKPGRGQRLGGLRAGVIRAGSQVAQPGKAVQLFGEQGGGHVEGEQMGRVRLEAAAGQLDLAVYQGLADARVGGAQILRVEDDAVGHGPAQGHPVGPGCECEIGKHTARQPQGAGGGLTREIDGAAHMLVSLLLPSDPQGPGWGTGQARRHTRPDAGPLQASPRRALMLAA